MEECQLAGLQEQRQVVVIATAVVAVVDMLEVVAAVLWRREALPCRRKFVSDKLLHLTEI